jgi:DNA-binding beta-propeller fold protein YncE
MAKIALPGVHGRIDHLAVDYYHPRLFIAAAGNDTVEVIDLRTNSLLTSIRGLTEPTSIAYAKSSNRLFVTNAGDGSVRVFDGTTLKPLSSLHLGTNPGTLRFDSSHDRVYIGYGDGAIAVLDSTGKRLADIPLKSHPESFQFAENQPRLFVNLPDSHTVAVIDTTALKVIAEWPITEGQENFPLAIDEEKRRVFVACRRPSRLIVLDMDTGHTMARLPTVGDANDLFYDAIHSHIYVVGGRGQFAIYRQRTADQYEQLDSVATAAGTRTGLFVPEWNRFFVAVRDFGPHMAEIRIYQPR